MGLDVHGPKLTDAVFNTKVEGCGSHVVLVRPNNNKINVRKVRLVAIRLLEDPHSVLCASTTTCFVERSCRRQSHGNVGQVFFTKNSLNQLKLDLLNMLSRLELNECYSLCP